MVEGYEGRPGAGKSAAMVSRAFKLKERGRRVYANIPLMDRRLQKRRNFFFGTYSIGPVNEATFGKSWADGMISSLSECFDLDNALILLDEVHMWMNSADWKDIPWFARRGLAQQRKHGLDFWWTAQDAARVYNVLRELTATLYTVERFGGVSVLTARDPANNKVLGKSYLNLGPQVYHLYDSEFEVGSADGGEAGRRGHNARYDALRSEHDAIYREWLQMTAPRRYRRVEEMGGRVRIVVDVLERNAAPELAEPLRNFEEVGNVNCPHDLGTAKPGTMKIFAWKQDTGASMLDTIPGCDPGHNCKEVNPLSSLPLPDTRLRQDRTVGRPTTKKRAPAQGGKP
jgi:hypothetical protein